MSALVRPDAHRNGRDEAKQDVGKKLVQLVQVSQVGIEEFLGPKGGQSAGKKKGANEEITTGASEVGRQVAFEDG